MNDSFWGGIIAGIPAILAGLLMLYKVIQGNRAKQGATTFAQLNKIIARLEKQVTQRDEQIDRHEKHMGEMQAVIDYLRVNAVECEASEAERDRALKAYHDIANRNAAVMQKAGLAVEYLPDLPPQRPKRPAPDFLARTVEQDSVIIKEIDKHIKPSSPES